MIEIMPIDPIKVVICLVLSSIIMLLLCLLLSRVVIELSEILAVGFVVELGAVRCGLRCGGGGVRRSVCVGVRSGCVGFGFGSCCVGAGSWPGLGWSSGRKRVIFRIVAVGSMVMGVFAVSLTSEFVEWSGAVVFRGDMCGTRAGSGHIERVLTWRWKDACGWQLCVLRWSQVSRIRCHVDVVVMVVPMVMMMLVAAALGDIWLVEIHGGRRGRAREGH
jgi:hypothetical protein